MRLANDHGCSNPASLSEISGCASKILGQFENFSDYCHNEVDKLKEAIEARSTICNGHFD